ncbi:FMN-binding domain protein [compost metagenome]
MTENQTSGQQPLLTALANMNSSAIFTDNTSAADMSTPPASSPAPAVQNPGNSGTSTSSAEKAVPSATIAPAKKSMYTDGTYTGLGSNRRGSIEVTVSIQNDQITDVEISQYDMHYSEGYVADLPSEVVQNQSPQVANVSGATYSSKAFKSAVQNALMSARSA